MSVRKGEDTEHVTLTVQPSCGFEALGVCPSQYRAHASIVDGAVYEYYPMAAVLAMSTLKIRYDIKMCY